MPHLSFIVKRSVLSAVRMESSVSWFLRFVHNGCTLGWKICKHLERGRSTVLYTAVYCSTVHHSGPFYCFDNLQFGGKSFREICSTRLSMIPSTVSSCHSMGQETLPNDFLRCFIDRSGENFNGAY